MKVRLVTTTAAPLPSAMKEALYRIAQEALNNILKHTSACAVTVRLEGDESQVVLEVVDDGLGFRPGAVDSRARAGTC